jgi:hypothetical protein
MTIHNTEAISRLGIKYLYSAPRLALKRKVNLIWVTDIVEQQYIMTARIVIKFQIGLK